MQHTVYSADIIMLYVLKPDCIGTGQVTMTNLIQTIDRQ